MYAIIGGSGLAKLSALDHPRRMVMRTPYGEPSRIFRRGGPGNTPLAVEGSRMPGGHPEGYVEGFANLYRGAAELISARRAGRAPEGSAKLTPTVLDGARGVAFVEAAVKSSQKDGAWTSARFG